MRSNNKNTQLQLIFRTTSIVTIFTRLAFEIQIKTHKIFPFFFELMIYFHLNVPNIISYFLLFRNIYFMINFICSCFFLLALIFFSLTISSHSLASLAHSTSKHISTEKLLNNFQVREIRKTAVALHNNRKSSSFPHEATAALHVGHFRS